MTWTYDPCEKCGSKDFDTEYREPTATIRCRSCGWTCVTTFDETGRPQTFEKFFGR